MGLCRSTLTSCALAHPSRYHFGKAALPSIPLFSVSFCHPAPLPHGTCTARVLPGGGPPVLQPRGHQHARAVQHHLLSEVRHRARGKCISHAGRRAALPAAGPEALPGQHVCAHDGCVRDRHAAADHVNHHCHKHRTHHFTGHVPGAGHCGQGPSVLRVPQMQHHVCWVRGSLYTSLYFLSMLGS